MTHSHSIIPAALADYCEAIRQSRLGWVRGNAEMFEAVVKDACAIPPGTPRTVKQIIESAVRDAVKQCGTQMKAAERLNISVGTVRNYLTAALMLVATCSFAQRGTLTPVVQPTIGVFNLAPAPSPVQSMSLTWDNVAPSYRVQVGATRGAWTNSFTISTNRFVLTNGQCYAVWSVANGAESLTPALWPSNRIGEIWLRGMGTNLTGGTNIQMLCKFTNQPPGHMQLWGVANITTGWE